MHGSQDIQDLVSTISTFEFGRGTTFRPLLQDIRAVLEVRNAIIYQPVPRETHWDVSICEWAGAAWEDRQEAYAHYIQRFGSDTTDFAAYDPFAVQATQRNCVLSQTDLEALDPRNARTHRRVLTAVGVSGEHQLRALVCEGPKLLAWVGVLQDEPFRPDQAAGLHALIEPLRLRLGTLSRLFPSALGGALLETLLAEMSEAVLVLAEDGRVELANPAAEELLASDEGRAEVMALRQSLRTDGACGGYRVTALSAPGLPRYRLAIRDRDALPTAVGVARAVRRWRLTPKLAFVLQRLCAGASNKEVADALGCAEVTVERHITRLFRLTGARSRTELVAKAHGS